MQHISTFNCNPYSAPNLRKNLRESDFKHFHNLHHLSSSEVDALIKSIATSFESSEFKISNLARTSLRGKNVFYIKNIEDELCIRATCRVLQSALRLNLVNRHNEVKQLMSILGRENKKYVFRTDVSSFFESIKFASVIERLESDGFRNVSVIKFLRSINKYLVEKYKHHGIPRGLGLSSLLADYVMREFDNHIINHNDILYYSRYVDDIITISSSAHMPSVVERGLRENGFQMNMDKTKPIEIAIGVEFDYLGYQLNITTSGVLAQIASTKINKIKKRICLTMQAYLKDRSFPLLLQRMKFLSSTIKMKVDDRNEAVFTGLRCVYSLCDTNSIRKQLINMDIFYRSILCSKRYNISRQLRSALNTSEMKSLKKISFKSSFDKKITYEFDVLTIGEIKGAWKYV